MPKKTIEEVISTAKELIADLEDGIKKKNYVECTARLNFHISTFDFYHDELVEELKLDFGEKV